MAHPTTHVPDLLEHADYDFINFLIFFFFDDYTWSVLQVSKKGIVESHFELKLE